MVSMLVHSIGQLCTASSRQGPVYAPAMHEITTLADAAIAIADDKILEVGKSGELLAKYAGIDSVQAIDAGGRLVTPGLVDAHTHLVFGGNRAGEFIMRCQGKTYAEIAEAGGGILSSMVATRKATSDELTATALTRLQRMLQSGTTTCEIKTGYGLDARSELLMLSVIYALQSLQPVEIVATFMPAHAVPPETDRESYVKNVIDDMLPGAIKLCETHGYALPLVDVFCDRGYFTLDDTERIFAACQKLGLKTKVHSDEFVSLGATALAARHKSLSADHLLSVSDEDIASLAASQTVAVLLPGTSFYLNLKEHAPARKMIEMGVALALGSDFNPGSCHIFSLPMIWALACMHLKLTPQEALTALSLNSAYAIGVGDKVGQITAQYQADITIYDVQSIEEIPYNIGWNPVFMTIKKGQVVHTLAGQ